MRGKLTSERIAAINAKGMQTFADIPIGKTIRLPVTCLRPTQPDDGFPTLGNSKNPISVALVDGLLTIIHGHHRYYRRLGLMQPTSIPRINVRRVVNPYNS